MLIGGAVIVNFAVVVLGALLHQAGDAVVESYLESPANATAGVFRCRLRPLGETGPPVNRPLRNGSPVNLWIRETWPR
ncbi:hypothetical protein [Streptosporangium sp. NPDC051022]|uniref:hypothetical protein n=1 Tax=Streptosporangium sp. NPDC051022 TaxID=3155752 RepID=UPI003430A186